MAATEAAEGGSSSAADAMRSVGLSSGGSLSSSDMVSCTPAGSLVPKTRRSRPDSTVNFGLGAAPSKPSDSSYVNLELPTSNAKTNTVVGESYAAAKF